MEYYLHWWLKMNVVLVFSSQTLKIDLIPRHIICRLMLGLVMAKEFSSIAFAQGFIEA